jgi:hypothetical protein
MTRVALFGGTYSNYLALEAAIADAAAGRCDYCLGDLGAFGRIRIGPLKSCEQMTYPASAAITTIPSAASWPTASAATPTRGQLFAQISYDYTLENTSVENRRWLRRCRATFAWNYRRTAFFSVTAAPGR